jgi:TolB protein
MVIREPDPMLPVRIRRTSSSAALRRHEGKRQMNKNKVGIAIVVGVLMAAEFVVGRAMTSQTTFMLEPTLAFVSTRDNTTMTPPAQGAEIYLTALDGVTNPRRLTENDDQDTFPVFSPNGKKLAFDSNRLRVVGENINISDLWVMDADGAQQTLLVKRAGSASWGPDSRTLVFHGSAGGAGVPIKPNDIGSALSDSDIFILLDVDDCIAGSCDRLNITRDPLQIDDDPDWSPDGSRIVFTSHSVLDTGQDSETAEIWTMNPDGNARVRLTFNGEEERAPSWSPDGTRIAFSCRALWLDSGTDFEICVMAADGSNLTVLTNNTVPDLTVNWTPDGSKIIFARPIGGFNQLFMMNADGTGLQQLTNTVGHNLFANPGYLRVRQDAANLSPSKIAAPAVNILARWGSLLSRPMDGSWQH